MTVATSQNVQAEPWPDRVTPTMDESAVVSLERNKQERALFLQRLVVDHLSFFGIQGGIPRVEEFSC